MSPGRKKIFLTSIQNEQVLKLGQYFAIQIGGEHKAGTAGRLQCQTRANSLVENPDCNHPNMAAYVWQTEHQFLFAYKHWANIRQFLILST